MGDQQQTLYRNIHATYRQINENKMGIAHMSSFNTPTLHLVNCIMRQDLNFCLCTQLFDTIIDAKILLRTTLLLPYLVTQFVIHSRIDGEFYAYAPSLVNIVIEYISVTYHATVPENWNRCIAEENIYATDLIQEHNDDTLFEQDLPANPSE